MNEQNPDLTFEQAVTRLEEIVGAMEAGTLPLDECLRQFELAVALSRHCGAQLQAAERQLQVLTREEGLRPAGEAGWPAWPAGAPRAGEEG